MEKQYCLLHLSVNTFSEKLYMPNPGLTGNKYSLSLLFWVVAQCGLVGYNPEDQQRHLHTAIRTSDLT